MDAQEAVRCEEGLDLAQGRVSTKGRLARRRMVVVSSSALPTIDLSTPWVPAAVFLAVPLTLMLAIAASRWLPGPGPQRELRVLAA